MKIVFCATCCLIGGIAGALVRQPLADAWIDLPAGSFKDAGTNVNAAIAQRPIAQPPLL